MPGSYRHYYYLVFKNDTSVTLASAFSLFSPSKITRGALYRLPPDDEVFYGYPDLVTALEKAKAGALAYIDELIRQGDKALPKLLQYRVDHYEDLNVNLVEDNIRRVEQELEVNPQFQWKPYRIQLNYDQ